MWTGRIASGSSRCSMRCGVDWSSLLLRAKLQQVVVSQRTAEDLNQVRELREAVKRTTEKGRVRAEVLLTDGVGTPHQGHFSRAALHSTSRDDCASWEQSQPGHGDGAGCRDRRRRRAVRAVARVMLVSHRPRTEQESLCIRLRRKCYVPSVSRQSLSLLRLACVELR